MGQTYKKVAWKPERLFQHSRELENEVIRLQKLVVELWDDMVKKGHFVTAWLLLEEGERKRHLLKGMEEACQHSSWHQDARALCPDITIHTMLKQRGRVFTDFLDAYREGKKGVGKRAPYSVPSEWWGKAAVGVTQTSSEEFAESTFTLMTLRRNEFISRFLLHAVMSVVHDLSHGGAGIDPVTDFMQTKGSFANVWSQTLADVRKKPIIRCYNCTKSSEEIGNKAKFMVCTRCKSKLDFAVNYCSKACQKEDWRNHKQDCGVRIVSKDLGPGTAQDPLWAIPNVPDDIRNAPSEENGDVSITSIGFGPPNPTRPYSPALQRQISLITADKNADYFLFDDEDRPVRFMLTDTWTKVAFRHLRANALSAHEKEGVEAIGEYLIKVMGQKPGLSRQRILEQFEKEYGRGVSQKITQFERKAIENGYRGSTFLEVMGRNLMGIMPGLIQEIRGTPGMG